MFGHHRSLRTLSILVLLCALLGLSLAACGNSSNTSQASTQGNAAAATTNTTPTVAPTNTSITPTAVPTNTASQPAQSVFSVTSVDMSVTPASLASYACGTPLTVTYTATFHFPAHQPGGQVMFQWTTTNGRGSTPASLTVPAGATSMPFEFKWSGQLPPDHTQPGLGGVMITWPNALTSKLVAPTGSCH